MKQLFIFGLFAVIVNGLAVGNAFAAVCATSANISSVIPSSGIAGLILSAPSPSCSCDSSSPNTTLVWIDTNTDAGKALYSTALAARISNTPVLVTLQDGLGMGAAGNQSITYRWWASCKVHALQM